MIITLDGESASGKTALAALLAERFGISFLESGKIYRGLTFRALQAGIPFESENALIRFVRPLRLEMREVGKRWHLVVNGRIDPPEELRSLKVTEKVGFLSRIPEIRRRVVGLQRSCYNRKKGDHLVAEGRTLGSVVFPRADFKIFVTASLEERAERRRINFADLGVGISRSEAEKLIQERDILDKERKASPLRIPRRAVILNTSGKTILESFQNLVRLINVRKKRDNLCYGFIRLLKFLPHFYLNLRAKGTEHLPPRGGFIVASNHSSNLDALLLGFASPRTLSFAARSSLFEKGPFFRWLISSLNAYPINRENPDRKTFFQFIHRLLEGSGVVYFPEGTRSRDGKMGAFKKGIGAIALRTTLPVIPAYIQGTREAMPPGFHGVKRGNVRVVFGPAVDFKDLYKLELEAEDFEKASARVRQAVEKLR